MPYRPSYYLGRMEELRQKWGGKCKRCPAVRKLHFAHVELTKLSGSPRGRGMANRYHDIKRNPGSYELLCPDCHARQELEMAVKRMKARPVFQGQEEREPGDDSGQEEI